MTKIGLQATLNEQFKLLLKIGMNSLKSTKILYAKMEFLGQVIVMHMPNTI